jgi:hypothetical protein
MVIVKPLKFLLKKIEDDNFNCSLEILYNYQIVGNRLNKLYEEACLSNDKYYDDTLELFRLELFAQNEIIKNLDSEVVISFIDQAKFKGWIDSTLNQNNIVECDGLKKKIFTNKI